MAQILCLFGAWAKQCRANAGLDIYVDMRRADTHANMQPNANVSQSTLYLLTDAVRFVALPWDSDQLLEVLFHLKKGLFGLWLV